MQPAFVQLRGIVELILKLEFVLQRVSVETINQPVPLRLWVVEMIQKPEFVLLRGSLQTIKQSEFEQLRGIVETIQKPCFVLQRCSGETIKQPESGHRGADRGAGRELSRSEAHRRAD